MRLLNVVSTDELLALHTDSDALTLCRVWKGLTESGEEVRLLVAQHGVNQTLGNWRAVKAQLDQLEREAFLLGAAGNFSVLETEIQIAEPKDSAKA